MPTTSQEWDDFSLPQLVIMRHKQKELGQKTWILVLTVTSQEIVHKLAWNTLLNILGDIIQTVQGMKRRKYDVIAVEHCAKNSDN